MRDVELTPKGEAWTAERLLQHKLSLLPPPVCHCGSAARIFDGMRGAWVCDDHKEATS
jgi:hypothetical protein